MTKRIREVVIMGHHRPADSSALKAALLRNASMPPEVLALEQEAEQRKNRKALEELVTRETEAALAKARRDDDRLAEGVYTGGADPAHVTGLDESNPDSETPENGDTERTDPNAS